jgi:hypothetical protein
MAETRRVALAPLDNRALAEGNVQRSHPFYSGRGAQEEDIAADEPPPSWRKRCMRR